MAATPITPVPVPRGVRVVVVVGGAFDPPHRFHRRAAVLAARRGWALVVPAARSPLKAVARASDRDRVEMVRLALRGVGRCSVWTDEVDRAARAAGPSFTIDTLTRLRRAVGRRVKLRLLIGADQAAEFHKWKEFRAVMSLAEPLVMPRGRIRTAAGLASALGRAGVWSEAEIGAWRRRFVRMKGDGVSSTRLRAALERGRGWALLPVSVRKYIEAHGLYRP